MEWIYRAARERGKYEAIGGHKAENGPGSWDKCLVCRRRVTDGPAGVRHAPAKRSAR